jgi:hypothetical protein
MQAELVDCARLEVLACCVPASVDEQVGWPGSFTSSTESVVDPARHKRVGRAAGLDDGLSWTVRDHEDRGVEGWLLAPPADAEVSHATTGDQRPNAAEVIGLELSDSAGERP